MCAGVGDRVEALQAMAPITNISPATNSHLSALPWLQWETLVASCPHLSGKPLHISRAMVEENIPVVVCRDDNLWLDGRHCSLRVVHAHRHHPADGHHQYVGAQSAPGILQQNGVTQGKERASLQREEQAHRPHANEARLEAEGTSEEGQDRAVLHGDTLHLHPGRLDRLPWSHGHHSQPLALPLPGQRWPTDHWGAAGAGYLARVLGVISVTVGHQDQVGLWPKWAGDQRIEPPPVQVLAWIEEDGLSLAFDDESIVAVVGESGDVVTEPPFLARAFALKFPKAC